MKKSSPNYLQGCAASSMSTKQHNTCFKTYPQKTPPSPPPELAHIPLAHLSRTRTSILYYNKNTHSIPPLRPSSKENKSEQLTPVTPLRSPRSSSLHPSPLVIDLASANHRLHRAHTDKIKHQIIILKREVPQFLNRPHRSSNTLASGSRRE